MEFDIVLLKGVLHHLTDDQIEGFFLDIKEYLNPNGRVVSVDPTFCEGQACIFDFHFAGSRENVKSIEEAKQFASGHFGFMEFIHTKQLFPPYDRVLFKGVV